MDATEFLRLIAFIGASIAIGLGAIGPGIGNGIVGAEGAKAWGKRAESRSAVLRAMIIGMAMSSTNGIFALLIAILLLFVVT